MNEMTTLLKGNLTTDPVKKDLGGKTVVEFGAVHKPRLWDRDKNGFVDGPGVFIWCSVWGAQGAHAYESLRKGDRVVAELQLSQRTITKNGADVLVTEGTVVEIGASLLFHEVDVDTDTATGGGSHTGAQGAPGQGRSGPPF